jgi:hypothetical protein
MQSTQHTLQGVLDDGNETLKLFRGEVTGALAEIDIGLLADQVGVAATDTLDLGQGVHDLLLSIDVRVQQTDDVLEAGGGQHCDSIFPMCSPCRQRCTLIEPQLRTNVLSSIPKACCKANLFPRVLVSYCVTAPQDFIDDDSSMLSRVDRGS